MIRFFDILLSVIGLILFLPLLAIIFVLVILESSGGGFYLQQRVGKDNVNFRLIKFRTMRVGSDKKGLITIGTEDPRITRTGKWLRKLKLDELPQLVNVLKGDMSMVGPRPEVRKYVALYSDEQLKVLSVRPGITDLASIHYMDENALLGAAENPDQLYVDKIMPEKLMLNMQYIRKQNVRMYFYIIFLTILKIIQPTRF